MCHQVFDDQTNNSATWRRKIERDEEPERDISCSGSTGRGTGLASGDRWGRGVGERGHGPVDRCFAAGVEIAILIEIPAAGLAATGSISGPRNPLFKRFEVVGFCKIEIAVANGDTAFGGFGLGLNRASRQCRDGGSSEDGDDRLHDVFLRVGCVGRSAPRPPLR
jgi:hypothetical protein